MDARKKTIEALTRQVRDSEVHKLRVMLKQADSSFEGDVRVAAEIPGPPRPGGIDNEVGKTIKRAIPEGYAYDPSALKPLARMLWAMSVSLGHAMTAHRQFTKLKSSTVSPDGMVGGRGYVMSVKDIRKNLYDACEALSAISDTIHDEINAPHWKPKLAQLEKEDVEDVERLVGEAERLLDDPAGEVEDDMEEAEAKGPKAKLEPKSEMPDGEDMADNHPQPKREKQAALRGRTAEGVMIDTVGYSYSRRTANSSLPVETMPGGPRVQHLDRGDTDQTGPYGSYNIEEPVSVKDEWSRSDGGGNGYDYPSEWDNNLLDKAAGLPKWPSLIEDDYSDAHRPHIDMDNIKAVVRLLNRGWPSDRILKSHAGRKYRLTTEDLDSFLLMEERGLLKEGSSHVPDANSDYTTRTEAKDFGIGYGDGNDAHGQGTDGYANPDPDGKGVFGPQSDLPHDPAGKLHDDVSDTTPIVELSVGQSSMPRHASYRRVVTAHTNLPNDGQPPVSRSDYYQGEKGNVVNVGQAQLPGTQTPAKPTPLIPRPAHNGEHMFSTSELPGEPSSAYEFSKDVEPAVGYRYERGDQPYIKWDSNTHNMRPDYTYQREVQGPYVKQQEG